MCTRGHKSLFIDLGVLVCPRTRVLFASGNTHSVERHTHQIGDPWSDDYIGEKLTVIKLRRLSSEYIGNCNTIDRKRVNI